MKNELFDDPIPALVVRKAIPMAMGVFAVILFALVDTWFISLLGTKPLAAMSFCFPVTFIVSSLAMGMGIGLGSNVSRILGSGKHHLAGRFTTDSLILAVLLVAILATCGILVINPLFALLGATSDILVYIRQYMVVWFMAIPLLVLPMVGNSAIRASGDVKTPSLVMLVSGGVNGILDPIFIFVFDWGVRGAALATACSSLITLFVAIHMLKNKLQLLTFEPLQWSVMKANWSKLLKIGIPASVAQMLNPIASAFVTAILSAYGVAGVAAYGVGSRLEALFLILVMATGSVMPTILGQNYGAGHFRRSAQTIRFATNAVIALYAALYLVIFLLARPLASLFTQDPAVLDLATSYLRILPISYALLGVGLVSSQILNVLHKPMISLSMNILRLFVFLIPCAWVGGHWYGTLGVYWGVVVAYASSGLLIYLYVQWLARGIAQQQPNPSLDTAETPT